MNTLRCTQNASRICLAPSFQSRRRADTVVRRAAKGPEDDAGHDVGNPNATVAVIRDSIDMFLQVCAYSCILLLLMPLR